jgi:F-type H+-transporting ATPase subunit a
LGGVDLSFTNSSLFMVVVTVGIIVLQYFGLRGSSLVPNRVQALFEASYDFIGSMVRENVGKEALPFAPLVFSLFAFVLMANLLGMLPYSFTVTSHVAVTLTLALMVFLTVTILGFVRHGVHFFSLFYPPGVPGWMAPLLVPMEIISFLIRPITLSVRLFLNMTAGHILLKVFAGFAVTLGGIYFIGPVLFNTAFIAFEFFVAFLQAYIFTILTCIYLNDAVHMH